MLDALLQQLLELSSAQRASDEREDDAWVDWHVALELPRVLSASAKIDDQNENDALKQCLYAANCTKRTCCAALNANNLSSLALQFT